MRPKVSEGLNLETNILMAYLARSSRDLLFLEFFSRLLLIDPETSNRMTALRTLLSLGSPSEHPFVNTARN